MAGEYDWLMQLPQQPTQPGMGFPAPAGQPTTTSRTSPGKRIGIDPAALLAAALGGQNNYGGAITDPEMQRARQQALMAMGANLLQSSGPSPTRVPFGAALGSSILAGNQAMREGEQQALQALLLKSQLAKNLRGEQTTAQKDFEYAKANGFKGSFEEWKKIAINPGSGAASLQEYNLYSDQERTAGRAPEDFMPWLKKRSAYSVGAPYTPAEMAGARGAFSRVTGGFDPTTTLPQEATATQTIEQAKTAGATTGKLGTEREFDRPTAQARLDSASQKLDLFIRKAGDIAADPSLSRATGLMAYVPSIFGGGAKNVENAIDALRAQLGFNELQEMRANSPTGGALGNVTERELSFLQNSLVSLERSQSPEQYRANLLDIVEYASGMRSRLRRAFDQTYPAKAAAGGRPSDDDLLRKYGGQ